MLETIIKYIANIVASLAALLVHEFLGLLAFDLDSLLADFPILWTGYRIFQSIGIGLVLAIMTLQIAKFFVGPLAESRDAPMRLLFRGAIAVIMIFCGNYFVEILVDVSQIPFNHIIESLEVPKWDEDFLLSLGKGFFEGGVSGIMGRTMTDGALLVLDIILVIMIAMNLLKLLLEIAERFLMIGVLAYSSPLAFATISSQATTSIFSKWVNMLCGQCLLMTISAWMLQLCITGFAFTSQDGKPSWLVFIVTLAWCKIAQRADSYLQQLGVGVATTGGSMVDEIMGVSRSLSHRIGGRGRAAQSGAGDGGDGGSRRPSLMSMATAPIANTMKFAAGAGGGLYQGIKDKAGIKDTLKNAATAGLQKTGIPTEGYQAGVFSGGNIKGTLHNAKQVLGGFYGFTSSNVPTRHIENPAIAARRAVEQTASFNRKIGAGGQYASVMDRLQPGGKGYDNAAKFTEATPPSIQEQAQISRMPLEKFQQSQLAAHGAGGITMNKETSTTAEGKKKTTFTPTLDDQSHATGVRWTDNSQDVAAAEKKNAQFAAAMQKYEAGERKTKPSGKLQEVPARSQIEGPDTSVGAWLAANGDVVTEKVEMGGKEGKAYQPVMDSMIETARAGSPLASEYGLLGTDSTMVKNDTLYGAMLENAIGEEAITQEAGGQFMNVRAETIEGQRVIQTDYRSKTGEMSHFTISQVKDAPGVTHSMRDQVFSTTTKSETGIFVRKSEYKPPEQSKAPQTKRSLFGREKNKNKQQ